MRNPYRQIKEIVDKHGMDIEEVIHALMATAYMDCCPHCNDQLQSDAFLKGFDHMAENFEFCRDVMRRRTS